MAINVFISYSTMDAHLKDAFKAIIKKYKGINPIVVEDEEEDSKYFTDKVIEHFEKAHYFVPIITVMSYQKSQWLNQEIGYAFHKLPKEKIKPLVEEPLITNKDLELKGFIHGNQKEVAYRFSNFNTDFTKACEKLIKNILDDNLIDGATGMPFEQVSIGGIEQYSEIKLPPERNKINEFSNYIIKIRLLEDQRFRFYFKFETVEKEVIYVGFTNDFKKGDEEGKVYKLEQEIGKLISATQGEEFQFIIPIQKELKELAPIYNKNKRPNEIAFRLDNIKLIGLRFRSDYNFPDEIKYSYCYFHRHIS